MASALVLCQSTWILPGSGISVLIQVSLILDCSLLKKIHGAKDCIACEFNKSWLCQFRINHKLCLVLFQVWTVRGQLQRRSSVNFCWMGHGRSWGKTDKNCDDSPGIWFGYFQPLECIDHHSLSESSSGPRAEHVCSCKSKLTGVLGSNVPTAHGKWQHHCGFIAWMLVTSRDLN